MANFPVPTRSDVAPTNQAIFDQLKDTLGFVPNLYATFAYSETALADYLALQNRTSSLRAREREAINLTVSQVNECAYCLAAHTVLGKMNGFTEDQILELRGGTASFDAKLNALVTFVRATTETHGRPDPALVDAFLAAGYTKENLVDVLVVIGDKIVSNYLHGITQIPVDFPAAPELEPTVA
ncbi:MAG: carboxymuconolactone decarboxylase family protein [Bacteroidota bacterium]